MRGIWSVAAFILILASQAGAQTINTAAGGGTIYLANNNFATRAAFYNPLAVAVDNKGNYYIADCNPNGGYGAVIYKVTSSGVITIVAGTGAAGYTGDGGLAANATFSNQVNSIAVAASGNIYISDSAYAVIRRVMVSDGTISTYAGSDTSKSLYSCGYNGDGQVSTSAWLCAPPGIWLDANNLYIVDAGNYRVRQVNSSNVISTIAGNGTKDPTGSMGNGGKATSAELASPTGVAEDSLGNIYFLDNPTNGSNSVVRKVTISTGIISQVPNILLPRSNNLAIDTKNDIFVISASQILEYVPSQNKTTAVAGGLSYGFAGDGGPAMKALLNNPYGVAVDSSGNVYIADTGNFRIREF